MWPLSQLQRKHGNYQNMSIGDGQDTMMSILSQSVNLQQQSTLPKPDIDYFDGGDVLSFASFMKNFKSLVEDITPSPVRRLEMLIKYTRGDAKSLIKDCILMEDPTEAYQRAVALLQTHYGHPAMIATAYRQKAEAWPSIRTGDREALRKYSVFLTGLISARRGTPDLGSVDGFEFLKILASKLPVPLQQQWITKVGKCRDELYRAPTFYQICQQDCQGYE